jgi:hypothetical protein
MENKRNELLYVDVYADDTGLFTEEECDYNNITTLIVPRWIVEEWYKQYEEEIVFDKWFREIYTCDDFIGFYDFCIVKGYIPNLLEDEVEAKVFFEDENDIEQIVYKGAYDECRRWGKQVNWKWKKHELKIKVIRKQVNKI